MTEKNEIQGAPEPPHFENGQTPPRPQVLDGIPPPPGVNGPFNPMMSFGKPGEMPKPPEGTPSEIYMPAFPPGLPIYKV